MKFVPALAVFFTFSFFSYAQVSIGRTSITNSSVLLEFGSDAKGIILPSLSTTPTNIGGTFIVNANEKAVQVYENNSWTNLSNVGELINHSFINTGIDVGEGVIIGEATSPREGVLVLESSTKAMILPKSANPDINIKSPVSGTILYDTSSSTLAIYDGQNWSYWK